MSYVSNFEKSLLELCAIFMGFPVIGVFRSAFTDEDGNGNIVLGEKEYEEYEKTNVISLRVRSHLMEIVANPEKFEEPLGVLIW